MSDHAVLAIKLAPVFGQGVAVIVCAFILFVGSVYVLLSAVFGLRMGYLVTAVSFFGWMIVLSALWTFGAPGTPRDLGPRGYEPHWQVLAAGSSDTVRSRYSETDRFPGAPWEPPAGDTVTEVDTVKAVVQNYLQSVAARQLAANGQKVCAIGAVDTTDCYTLDPTTFSVQDILFTTSGGTQLVGTHAYFQSGGPEITVFAYFDQGNVAKYSYGFLGASIFLFLIHLPFLDRAERKRKEILTGGTAPPWYGPA